MIRRFDKPIYVSRPFLPPIEQFYQGIKEIWETRWLTNNGPILQRFTKELANYFETDNLTLFNNGTLALQLALQGMGISGEVITTPFTFVATAHALYWNKIKPVFVDIEPKYYTIDPMKVEEAITPWTTAILAVHVYGHPCKLDQLADIARRHNLKLIYDAAHAFGVKVGNKSIAHFGDLSMFSFHATKLFHSLEGGLLIYKEDSLKSLFDYLKNFGFKNEVEVVMPGTNAKMNEMQALMGSLVLKYIENNIHNREILTNLYRCHLKDIPGIHFPPALPFGVSYNHAYLVIEVDKQQFGMSRDALYEHLKHFNIFTRRYFYPLICDFACYRTISVKAPLVIARQVADRILALPLYDDLPSSDVAVICQIIRYLHHQAWSEQAYHPHKTVNSEII